MSSSELYYSANGTAEVHKTLYKRNKDIHYLYRQNQVDERQPWGIEVVVEVEGACRGESCGCKLAYWKKKGTL